MIDGILLIRLEDCAASSRLGMADKAFPQDLARLAARGLVAAADGGGYKVTVDGLAFLRVAKQSYERQEQV
jgi:hypothetical protein